MYKKYPGVVTRFLRQDERLILSEEKEMPLVIEAEGASDFEFLQHFLVRNSHHILKDLTYYGAVLLRGFSLETDEQFEKLILSIPEFRGISEAFMSENGRDHLNNLDYVLHTNSVYKTGGTLYLGGFHTENYYSADVPGYLCFCCFQPSELGGETGLINSQKIYAHLNDELKQKLEEKSFFVCKWTIAEIADRYKITPCAVDKICHHFKLPVVGEGEDRFVLMYKPSVLEHPITHEKALQINMFELETLNYELRKCFMKDYKGKAWFWHRFFWKLPTPVFNSVEKIAVIVISFSKSPKNSYKILRNKLFRFKQSRKVKHFPMDTVKVGSCFDDKEVKELALSMRQFYSSCLWKKGDVLLIDNRKVMHAGMPGFGNRLIRAMICNPLDMSYSEAETGILIAKERITDTIGAYMEKGKIETKIEPISGKTAVMDCLGMDQE
ncbi:pyoverdine biosynthesis regulatory gene SyrP-like protein [Legionella wadsworthii]|uniref:Pyoverdine biosynthesis regulatory gene SyrP-like protein n=1 Tax=Legionella wadsworthii TaxID=28088 RepID=A0A378LV07_9GAMM|nr:TauD/TfdA family dioxygenase [Legionella wadsworthii]STY30360.1 pyoverdine biosynthesis regulatory gene SyrP-like protein [Legionella wadsworthii]